MGNAIAEALVRNRMKNRLSESSTESVHPEDLRELESMLNHQLGEYETGVRVTGAKIISQTPTTSTYKVEYDVDVKIPTFSSEDHRMYYESEVESRSRTITIETVQPKKAPVSAPPESEEVTDTEGKDMNETKNLNERSYEDNTPYFSLNFGHWMHGNGKTFDNEASLKKFLEENYVEGGLQITYIEDVTKKYKPSFNLVDRETQKTMSRDQSDHMFKWGYTPISAE